MPVVTVNGVATYYEVHGEGPAIVFIHGHTSDGRLWLEQTPVFARHYKVITYDVRGHGRSAAPPTGYSWADYAADLSQLLTRLGVERAHAVGLSMGGGVALQLALDYPSLVGGLVLADSALEGYHYGPEFEEAWERLIILSHTEGLQAAMMKVWLHHPLFRGLRRFPDRFRLVQEMALGFSGADYFDTGDQEARERPQITRLDEVRCPTLVLVGELDIDDFHIIADILATNIVGAEKRVIADAGHVSCLEQPEAFNQVVASFLDNVARCPHNCP